MGTLRETYPDRSALLEAIRRRPAMFLGEKTIVRLSLLLSGIGFAEDYHDVPEEARIGGFGTPEGGFVFRWRNSAVSRERLGYAETVRQLERRLTRCHPSNRQSVGEDLERARQGVGPTVFDWLIEIIQEHSAGGREQEDGVELELY